jgi:hypothetical protein
LEVGLWTLFPSSLLSDGEVGEYPGKLGARARSSAYWSP